MKGREAAHSKHTFVSIVEAMNLKPNAEQQKQKLSLTSGSESEKGFFLSRTLIERERGLH